jgi:pyridinium-3,5-biscarboxylic acid mononucleotide sulfurtransferase
MTKVISLDRDELRLAATLDRHRTIAIAVSGGIDSMTLAHVAHRSARVGVTIVHAVSPAVPQHATDRVRRHAMQHNWALTVFDASEFQDHRYLDNPINRCYFCKSNLYDRICELTGSPIASGANLDDLNDYRPGLIAAKERRVVHPFVDAGFNKLAIRALAHRLQLTDLAELPAQPCLASRIETGIAISAPDLAFVDTMEQRIAALLPLNSTIRCRVTTAGIALEIGPEAAGATSAIDELATRLCRDANRPFVGVRPYRRGSAFAGTSR